MSKQKLKHSSLTHFMRRKCDPEMAVRILARCDVSPRVGCLPPQLVPLVRPQDRADVTDIFGEYLEEFFVQNKDKIIEADSDITFAASDISALFNTECVIKTRGVNVYGVYPWGGNFGIVCKVSFPKINAEYALKLWCLERDKNNDARFEIPTAFAANHAEPRDNCPVYMASLNPGREFMLSQWAGDVADGKVRENKYSIYYTDAEETRASNLRGGRRIDYGETFQTDYGRAPYTVRKMFRKILNAARGNFDFDYMYRTARTAQNKKDFIRASRMAYVATLMNDEYSALDAIERVIKSFER